MYVVAREFKEYLAKVIHNVASSKSLMNTLLVVFRGTCCANSDQNCLFALATGDCRVLCFSSVRDGISHLVLESTYARVVGSMLL